ncbi:hypothetical protein LINPERPRIM_LOCUS34034 [Linum perenne]
MSWRLWPLDHRSRPAIIWFRSRSSLNLTCKVLRYKTIILETGEDVTAVGYMLAILAAPVRRDRFVIAAGQPLYNEMDDMLNGLRFEVLDD